MEVIGVLFDTDYIPMIIIFAIPIVAIVGGITAGIVKTITEAKIVENAQRERIAAIQAGLDPSKLPPLHGVGGEAGMLAASPEAAARHRSQGLMIGGIITFAVGAGLMAFLFILEGGTKEVWAVGLIPASIGLALLLSSWLVRPRGGGA